MRSPILLALLLSSACYQAKPIVDVFSDTFDRSDIGPDYRNTGGPYRIEKGQLKISKAYNHPLWLRRPLPRNALIEIDVTAQSTRGDIKLEAWGDGESHAQNKGAYLATSYVFVHGGWNNTISALCRLDEHGRDRKQRKAPKVEADRTYHWKIRRMDRTISWAIDGETFLELEDPTPLAGKRHAYFGFNNWQGPVVFDNLKITPL